MKNVKDWTIIFKVDKKNYEAMVLVTLSQDDTGKSLIDDWKLADPEIYDIGRQEVVKEQDITKEMMTALKEAIYEHETED